MGADMLFIAAGMGGGTGTGAAPIIAQIARDAGILTVAVVSKPFSFEGTKRMKYADEGIEVLNEWVDSLIIIPNEKLAEVYGNDNALFESFTNADDTLGSAVKGIAEIITIRGFINVDFADVKTVMSGRGKAMMGLGLSSGENRAEEAVDKALNNPLLDNIELQNASGVLVNITAGADLSSKEFDVIGRKVREIARDDATIIIGCIKEENNTGDLRVTLVATGFDTAVSQASDIEEVSNINETKPSMPSMPSMLGMPITTTPMHALDNTTNEKVTSEQVVAKENVDNIDIPAFLRQQAD